MSLFGISLDLFSYMYLSIKKRGRYNTLLLCIYLPTNFSIPRSKYMMATRFDWWSWNHVITHHFLSIGRNQLLANTKLGVPRIENENWGTRLSSSSTVVVWRFTDLKKMIVMSLGITLFLGFNTIRLDLIYKIFSILEQGDHRSLQLREL